MKTIGFIGVGIMGKSMVRNLMKAGFEVRIYARNKEKVKDVIAEGAKLANQIMQASIMSGVCEALAYVREQGLDPEVFMKGAATGAGQNALLESYGEIICKDDLEPGFFVDFFIKDMKLAYDSAKLGGLELDVLGRVIENYQQLSDEGLGRAGMQALIKHYEK